MGGLGEVGAVGAVGALGAPDEVVAVGVVPDPVLLLCGRPSSVPSAWWTPTLVDDDQDTVDRLLAAAAATLEEHGVRDPASGTLNGPLGAVQAIVAEARLLVLLETTRPDGTHERRSVIVAEHDAVLDRQTPDGDHDLLLAGAQATAALLVELLRATMLTTPTPPTSPTSGAVGATIAALAGRRTPAEVAAALPEHERTATVRVTRQTAGPDPRAHMLTVVNHPDHPAGAVVCWALPGSSDVEVQPLGADGVTELALALLGAEPGEGIA